MTATTLTDCPFPYPPKNAAAQVLTSPFLQAKKFDSVWEEDIVAGRSYATDELLTVTKGADEVKKAYQTGEFQEASAYLNNRMQPVAALYQGRKPSRWATYSQAVHESHQQLRVGDDIVEEDMGSPF